jgi:tetratricopeptide (TPR) repeat protein
MTASETTLTASEFLQLALAEMARGRLEEAIDLSKRALRQYPNSAETRYLLGAQYAQIGLYERAVAEMARALEDDPDLLEARFQLGLLQLTQGSVDRACESWEPLQALARDHPLHLFQKGLRCMVEERFDEACACLAQGIERNMDNEALNSDMRHVIAEMRRARSAPNGEPVEAGRHVLLSAYQDR